jgi:hypothetical protein
MKEMSPFIRGKFANVYFRKKLVIFNGDVWRTGVLNAMGFTVINEVKLIH